MLLQCSCVTCWPLFRLTVEYRCMQGMRLACQINEQLSPTASHLQAGIVAALTALLRAAAGPSTTSSSSPAPVDSTASPGGSPGAATASPPAPATAPSPAAAGATWRKVLRGVGAEALAPEVLRLGAALHRIASVSSAVAGPVVFAPLLAALQAAAPAWQRRRH